MFSVDHTARRACAPQGQDSLAQGLPWELVFKLRLADHADRSDQSGNRPRSRCRQARVRCDDADEKIDIAAIEKARRG